MKYKFKLKVKQRNSLDLSGYEFDCTCLCVNLVVPSEKVWQAHHEEAKTADLKDYNTDKHSIISIFFAPNSCVAGKAITAVGENWW